MVVPAVFFGVFFGVYVGMLCWLPRPRRRRLRPHRPQVSILVAARNEAACIERCLQSLAQLRYPAALLEIIVADDHSTDNTAAVVAAFIRDKPHFKLLRVRQYLGAARGKANALAHLCRAATADYFLFTDADMVLPPDWVGAMLAGATPGSGVGVVTGMTTAGGSLFGRLQGLDWLFGLNLIRVLADCGLPGSAVGNNMLVTRAAYESIGGFEALAFSVSDDLLLFNSIVARGWGFRHLCEPATLGTSLPQPDVPALLRQRKRWMSGAGRLPWYLTGLFGLYGTFYAVLAWPGLLPLSLVLGIYLTKIVLQTVFLVVTLRQAGHRGSWAALLLYEPYLCVMSVMVLVYSAWPGPIEWKQRRYAWSGA